MKVSTPQPLGPPLQTYTLILLKLDLFFGQNSRGSSLAPDVRAGVVCRGTDIYRVLTMHQV